MELLQILDKYKSDFKSDPLLNRIRREGLEENLFDDENYFSKVNFTDTYTTSQAVVHLAIVGKEQTLLNLNARNDMKNYLGVNKQGRTYRYDWVSMFKFKMILLLTNNDFSPMDIAIIIGTRFETSMETPGEYSQGNQGLQKTEASIRDIAEEVSYEHSERIMLTIKNLELFKDRQAKLESQRDTYMLDLKLHEERIWSIQGRLDDLDGYLTFMKVSNSYHVEGSSPGGMLGWLFKSKDVNHDSKQEKIQNEFAAFEEKKKNLTEAKIVAEEEKEQLTNRIKAITLELTQLQDTAATQVKASNVLGVNEQTNMKKGVSENVYSKEIDDVK